MKKIFPLLAICLMTAVVISGCVQNNNALATDDIRAEFDKLDQLNKYPENMNINEGDYPKIIGIDGRNGKQLKEIYFCMDICPNYANIKLVYDGVDSKEECEQINGKTLETGIPAPGIFIGCEPKV